MKMRTVLALALSACFGASQALVVNYQPTPYPLKMADGSAMPQDLDKIHVIDGWLTNSYQTSLVRDGQLKIGGWGDVYVFGLNFDLTGLPINPNRATLWLNSFAIPGNSTQTQYQICIPSAAWDAKVTFATRPALLGCTQPYAAPGYGWSGWTITSWYQNWQSGVWGRYGMMFSPMANNNNFVQFRSSRYADFAADPAADGKRPLLQFDITPSIELKMPLPAGYTWQLTNEIGGFECRGTKPWPDIAHQGTNYFSLDISYKNSASPGSVSGKYSQLNTPVLAAAYGKIVFAGGGNNPGDYNGYNLTIDHDGDGNLGTGFQTRYLHFKGPAARKDGTLLKVGDIVQQGDQIGVMGTTGKMPDSTPTSTGVHLHFGLRYKNDGSPSVQELTRAVMEGLLWKSYQTECKTNTSGVPTDWGRYYNSTNVPTGK